MFIVIKYGKKVHLLNRSPAKRTDRIKNGIKETDKNSNKYKDGKLNAATFIKS